MFRRQTIDAVRKLAMLADPMEYLLEYARQMEPLSMGLEAESVSVLDYMPRDVARIVFRKEMINAEIDNNSTRSIFHERLNNVVQWVEKCNK